MARCKNGQCGVEKEDVSIITKLESGEKRFSFPKLGISVIAKSLEEAQEKVKKMTSYENKSL